jgi:ArsR family transcriptional regulator, nickel/cobalt-responsive transcriptional repressor
MPRLGYDRQEVDSDPGGVGAMDDQLQSRECAQYLKALADPERLKIVQCLLDGPKNVSELSALLEQEMANVSHHLGVLRHSGLVLVEKQGKFMVYSLHPDIFRPQTARQKSACLDLGCCRLELTGK